MNVQLGADNNNLEGTRMFTFDLIIVLACDDEAFRFGNYLRFYLLLKVIVVIEEDDA